MSISQTLHASDDWKGWNKKLSQIRWLKTTINLFSHSSGGEKSKIKVSAELSSLWRLQGRIPPCPSSFWWLLLTFGSPGLQMQHFSFRLCLHMASPWCVFESKFPSFHRDTGQWISVRPSPVWPHGNLVHQQRPYLNGGFTTKLNWFSHYGKQYGDFLKN